MKSELPLIPAKIVEPIQVAQTIFHRREAQQPSATLGAFSSPLFSPPPISSSPLPFSPPSSHHTSFSSPPPSILINAPTSLPRTIHRSLSQARVVKFTRTQPPSPIALHTVGGADKDEGSRLRHLKSTIYPSPPSYPLANLTSQPLFPLLPIPAPLPLL
jgi:hypothetical protein